MKLNPIWLNTFKILIEKRNFTQAAEQLHMTQPGVSQQIKKLEEACAYPLIDRQKKRFEITRQGELLYDYIKAHENDEAGLIEQLGFDNTTEGSCYLSCSGSLAMLLYPALMALQIKYPKLIIHLEAAPNNRILEQIHQGQIDIGIVTQQPDPLYYTSEIIGTEALAMVFPAQTVLYIETLPQLMMKIGVIRHPDIEHYLRLFLAHTHQKQLSNIDIQQLPIRGYVNQIHQILLPVSKGLGFTVIPHSTIKAFQAPNQLTVLNANNMMIETLYLAKRLHRELPARFTHIIDTIKHTLV